MLNKRRSPEMMYATIFYIFIFSIIPHKEKRFLVPVVPFCMLALGYMLLRKLKSWKSKVTCLIWFSVIAEIIV